MSEIYWVIGGSANVGKTTVACGLLRALTQTGRSTMGFKPHSAQDLFTQADIMENNPNGQLLSEDGKKLLEASSALKSDETLNLLEVVQPNKCIYFASIQNVFMLRTGAPSQGFGQFCHVKNEANVLGRADVRDFLKRKELYDQVVLKPPVEYSIGMSHKLFSENINASMERLQQYQHDALVIEGSASLLPIWQGSPMPDHIVGLNGGVVEIISGIDDVIQQFQQAKMAPRTRDLYDLGADIAQKSFQIEIPLVLADQREAEITSTMKTLLIHAGI